MIINNKYKFAFVHIPKCAGTMMRNKLVEFDDLASKRSDWISYHPQLGLIDYGHLPLFTLRDYFKDDFDKVNDYWSFSFIRDPYKRFPSSLAQRLKMYGEKQIEDIAKKDIKSEIDNLIIYLTNNSEMEKQLPAEYIHFQRQYDYIYIEEQKIIDSVYSIDSFDIFQKDFIQYSGCEIDLGNSRNNDQSIVQRNNIAFKMAQYVHPVSKFIFNYISENNKAKISSLLYVSRDDKFKDILESNFVKDFISDYYKLDIQLFDKKISKAD